MFRRTLFRATALAVSLLGPALLCDRAVQALRPAAPSGPDYGALWASPPGPGGLACGLDIDLVGGRARTTSLGLRGVERPTLLAIGDSFTCGYRLDQSEMWALRLGQPAACAHADDPSRALARYEAVRAAGIRPSTVVVGVCLGNDVVGASTGADRSAEIPCDPPPPSERGFVFLPNLQSMFFRGPNAAQPQGHAGPNGRLLVYDRCSGLGTHLAAPPAPLEAGFDRIAEALARLCLRVLADGGRFFVVVFPQRYAVQAGDRAATVAAYGLREEVFAWDRPAARIMAGLRARGVPALDTTAALRRAHEATGKSMYLDGGDMHQNALAQDVVVAAIREAF